MKISRIFLTLALLIFGAGLVKAQSADHLMQRALAKINAAGCTTAQFKVTSGKRPVAGKLVVQGKAYTLNADRLNIWFDGTTQWVYNPSDNEITVTKPTVNEQLESNPFMLVSEYKTRYKLSKSGDRTVVLTPRKGGIGISSARITFGADGMPSRLTAVYDNGTSFSAEITRISFGPRQPETVFELNPKKYPRAEVIDLR